MSRPSTKRRKICIACNKNETTGKWCYTCAPRQRAIALKAKYAAGYAPPWDVPESETVKINRRKEFVIKMAKVRYEDISA